MKKLLAILALVAATSAMAESNVTVYGTVDAGLATSTSDTNTANDRKSGVYGGLLKFNHLGVKGSEDLGNGVKAIFQAEFGFDFGQNSGLQNARESFVGLDLAKAGVIKLGRLETLDSVAATQFDAMGASAFSPVGVAVGRETFANSAIGYSISPFKGLQLVSQFAFDGSSASANTAWGGAVKQERDLGLGAVYTEGPLEVGYVFTKAYNYGRVDQDDRRQHLVGGSYDFQVVKAYASIIDAKSDKAATLDTRVYTIGAKVPVSAKTTIDTSYARVNDDLTNGHANIYGVQAVYAFSKRTSAYAGYQYVANDRTTFAALGTNGVTPVASGNGSGIGAGLKVSF